MPTQTNTSMSKYYHEAMQKQLGRPHQRQRKQVRFCEQTMKYDALHSPLNEEEQGNMWYRRADIAFFQLVARDYALGKREQSQETRGFERYENLERAKYKTISMKCVLLAIRKGMKQCDVAIVARRCSEASTRQAFLLGCQDYYDAYQPHMIGLLIETSKNVQSNKRPSSSIDRLATSTASSSKRIRTC